MKKKNTHYKSVHIKYHIHSDTLFKLQVFTYPYPFSSDTPLCEFFIPRKDNQRISDIDHDAVKSRIKRDFFITFDHNSATYC